MFRRVTAALRYAVEEEEFLKVRTEEKAREQTAS